MKKLHGKPITAGNWKMHKTIPQAVELVQAVRDAAGELKETELVVIPPFTALSEVKKILQESPVEVGAQNIYWEEEGAYTGEISPSMLKDLGCTHVVIGHSERREYFGETNQTVNKKINAALDHNLTPIVCIGETKEEREEEKTHQKIKTQITEGFKNMGSQEVRQVIIAYEPIWAIGTGLTATPDQAQSVHHFIRDQLKEAYGKEIADYAIILYGGSVKPKNAYSLVNEPDINGTLIGGASLKSESFIQIAKESIRAYKDKK